MKGSIPKTARCRRNREGGFALLLVIFLMALMLIAVMTAAPEVRTERKREREEEMIWRGKQYERGIKLYYRKTGKFPTNMDDLTKPKLGSLRFMRQEYPDPMNKKDGSWRLIYVGPAGNLIGSLNPSRQLQMPGVPQIGTPVAAMGSQQGVAGAPNAMAAGGATGIGASQAGAASPGGAVSDSSFSSSFGSSFGGSSFGSMFSGNNSTAFGSDGENAPPDLNNPAVGGNVESPTIMGGNIIGVGSKINERSVITFEKARNYRLFEFIWDPSKDVITIGGSATPAEGVNPIGTPVQSNPNGFSPMNSPTGAPPPGSQQPQPPPGNMTPESNPQQ